MSVSKPQLECITSQGLQAFNIRIKYLELERVHKYFQNKDSNWWWSNQNPIKTKCVP